MITEAKESQEDLQYMFFITDHADKSVWGIYDFDKNDPKRLGWLHGRCVFIDPNDTKNYVGADGGFDALHVFEGKKWDYSKTFNKSNP